MYKHCLLALAAITFLTTGMAQEQWKLKLNKEGIAVYSKPLEHSRLKAIKVECVLPARLSQLVAVILDVNTGAEWVYSTKSSVLLKQVAPGDLYYYSEVSIPWPASNRDFVAHLITEQDSATKVVTINGPTVPGYVPVKESIVRVPRSAGKWVITPLQKNSVKVEYLLEVDPGGSIPIWIVNLFAAKGPFETFRNLKNQLRKPSYANAKLPFIKE